MQLSRSNLTSSAPIRGYSRKGFVIGWIAIVGVVAISFWIASGMLSHSSAKMRLAAAPNVSQHLPG